MKRLLWLNFPMGTLVSDGFLIPNEGIGINNCLYKLNGEIWSEYLNNMKYTLLSTKLPKFKVKQKQSLIEGFMALGIKKAFSQTADFTGICNKANLRITAVDQGCFINVDENGIEASSVTSVAMLDSSLPPNNDGITSTPIDFHITRPFLFFIKGKNTGTILFMGKIEKL